MPINHLLASEFTPLSYSYYYSLLSIELVFLVFFRKEKKLKLENLSGLDRIQSLLLAATYIFSG
jgi:hypothetical protein